MCHECEQLRAILAETDEQLEAAIEENRALKIEVERLGKVIEDTMMDASHSADAYGTRIESMRKRIEKLERGLGGKPTDPEGGRTAFPGRGKSGGLGPWGRKRE